MLGKRTYRLTDKASFVEHVCRIMVSNGGEGRLED